MEWKVTEGPKSASASTSISGSARSTSESALTPAAAAAWPAPTSTKDTPPAPATATSTPSSSTSVTHSFGLGPLQHPLVTSGYNDLDIDILEVEGEGASEADNGHDHRYATLRHQDLYLPSSSIHKIMRRSLPQGSQAKAKIALQARQTIQECVSEFISFVTSEMADHATDEKRKTMTADDMLYALQALGFEKYVQPLKTYLERYRQSRAYLDALPTGEVVDLNNVQWSDVLGDRDGTGGDGQDGSGGAGTDGQHSQHQHDKAKKTKD